MASETFGGDSYQTPAAAIYARYNKSALYPAIEKTLQPCPEACDAQYMCGKLCLHPSLYLDQHNGGGVETTGAIEWVHAMLLQSRDGVLRLFPHLPETTRAARFVRLRTYVPHAPLGCSLQDWHTERRRYLSVQGRCVSGDCELQRGSCGVAGAGAERSRAALHHGGTHA